MKLEGVYRVLARLGAGLVMFAACMVFIGSFFSEYVSAGIAAIISIVAAISTDAAVFRSSTSRPRGS